MSIVIPPAMEYHSSFSAIIGPVYVLRIFPLFTSQLKGYQTRVSLPTATPYAGRSTKHGRVLLFDGSQNFFSLEMRGMFMLLYFFIFLLRRYLNTSF
jgi:hypothetical protein